MEELDIDEDLIKVFFPKGRYHRLLSSYHLHRDVVDYNTVKVAIYRTNTMALFRSHHILRDIIMFYAEFKRIDMDKNSNQAKTSLLLLKLTGLYRSIMNRDENEKNMFCVLIALQEFINELDKINMTDLSHNMIEKIALMRTKFISKKIEILTNYPSLKDLNKIRALLDLFIDLCKDYKKKNGASP